MSRYFAEVLTCGVTCADSQHSEPHISLRWWTIGRNFGASRFIAYRRVDQEWFLERYHPKTEESKRYTKIKWVDSESAEFSKQLRANPRQFIASASLDPISEVFSCFFFFWHGVLSLPPHGSSLSHLSQAHCRLPLQQLSGTYHE